MRINLTGLTDWQVPCIRSVPSVIPPSLQIYALRVAGIDEGSAVYLRSIPHITIGGDNLAIAGVTLRYSTVPGQETLPGVARSEAR